MAKGGAINLPALLDALKAGRDRISTFSKPIPLSTHSTRKDLLAFMVGSLEQASLHREKALTNLTEAERHFDRRTLHTTDFEPVEPSKRASQS